jgi:hypothetical protein
MLRQAAAKVGRTIGETVADGIIEAPQSDDDELDELDDTEGFEEEGGRWILTRKAADAAGWPTLPEVNALGQAVHAWHDRAIYPKGHPHAPDLIEAIFNFSDVTRFWLYKTREFHAPAGPVAAYLTWLVRLGVRMPANFQLDQRPATLFISRYGQSGTGKSTSVSCALSVPCPDPPWYAKAEADFVLRNEGKPDWDLRHTLGSGEVVRIILTVENADGERVWKLHPVAWFEEAESEAFYARAAKAGSTIIQELNKCHTGETPGTSTITGGYGGLVDAPFAGYWTGAVQDTVWPKLQGAMSGWNQRNLACSSDDVWARFECSVPRPPVGYTPPGVPELPGPAGVAGYTYCEAVEEATRAQKWTNGLVPVLATDGRDTHRLWNRKRLAAHVAIAHGKTHIDEAIWEHTGYLMEHHDRVVAMADAAAARVIDEENFEKGRKMSVTDSARQEGGIALAQEARSGILKALRGAGGPKRKEDVRLGLPSRVRGCFRSALIGLQSDGKVLEEKVGREVRLSLIP